MPKNPNITENISGSRAPVFHGTDLRRACDILDEKLIHPTTHYQKNDSDMTKHALGTDDSVNGISTTRDPRFDYVYSQPPALERNRINVRFVIDLDYVSRSYQVKQIDYFGDERKWGEKDKLEKIKAAYGGKLPPNWSRVMSYPPKRGNPRSESEEFIITDVGLPVNNKTIRKILIDVNDNVFSNDIKYVDHIISSAEKLGIPVGIDQEALERVKNSSHQWRKKWTQDHRLAAYR